MFSVGPTLRFSSVHRCAASLQPAGPPTLQLTRSASAFPSLRVLEQILDAILVNEEIGLRAACDADDVFIVILNPAAYFLAIDQFDDHRRLILREPVDVF